MPPMPGSPSGDLAPISDTDWVRSLLHGLPDERLEEVEESSEFVGELRHYQRRGLAWMQFLSRLGLGGCLADDMGLGKTATTLAHLVERPGPHLVVCPLSVVRNWHSESHRFTPKLEVSVHHGSQRDKQLDLISKAMEHAASDGAADEMFLVDPELQIVITTYGLLPRDLEHLGAIEWSTVVLDEAQMVKNPNTKAAKAVRQLRADQKIALTGTPVENRLSELWAILDAVNPGILGGLERFRKDFASPIERATDPEASADAAARLRRITGPFILRRTKADKRLLPDLPDKIEQIAYAKLTKEQAALYQQVVDQLLVDAEQAKGMRRRGLVLAALMRLKQICNHPAHALKDGSRLAGRSGKLTRFDELVTDLLDQGERALVFTQFREMGELLVRHVNEQFSLRRAVPARRRDPHPARFDGRRVPGRHRPAVADRVAQGRRHRPQPDRREPGHPLRPVVEPGGRGPGDRPCVADRPDADGQRPQAGVRGHGRGEGEPGHRRQAQARRAGGRHRRGRGLDVGDDDRRTPRPRRPGGRTVSLRHRDLGRRLTHQVGAGR